MISIGRYSPEKQLDHQIELMSKLVPDFQIYSYIYLGLVKKKHIIVN